MVYNARVSMPTTPLVVSAGQRAVSVASVIDISAGTFRADVNGDRVEALTRADLAELSGQFTFSVTAVTGPQP